MSITTRLQRVTQSLTPLQRALLVLQALREGREMDAEVRDIKDEQQRRAFNRYIAYLWVINHQLGAVAAITAHRVDIAENEKTRFLLLNEAADELDQAEGKPRSKGIRSWRNYKGTMEVAVFLRSLALECRDDGAALVTHLWHEVQSLEQVWRDLSLDFAGEDVAMRENRELVDEATTRLRACAAAFGVKKLPTEPEARHVEAWTSLVNDSFRHLGLAEPY